MDLPRSRRSSYPPLGRRTESGVPYATIMDEKKAKLPGLLACIIISAVLASLIYYNLFSSICENQHDQPQAKSFELESSIPAAGTVPDDRNLSERSASIEADNTLGGLLPDLTEFESDTCASRRHQPHRKTNFKPSRELVKRLRQYEIRHRECTARAYDQSFFRPGNGSQYQGSESHADDCRYVVWIAYSGLGNRLMTLVSAFLYALLTSRTLLVDRSTDMSDLFCEPIPRTSWLVPPEMTVKWIQNLNESSPRRFGHRFSDEKDISSTANFSYVHLTHTSDDKDQEFFCNSGQDQLATEPWLFIKANTYLVPDFFFLSRFSSDLEELFPDKELIFHLLGRYLFHPSDEVWSRISRFHKAYLARHDQQVGIQIRTFNDTPLPYFSEQIQQCVRQHDLLPKVAATSADQMKVQFADLRPPKRWISVLVTDLKQYYYENLRDYYLSGPAEGDESVAIHQPSHEGWQQTDRLGHNTKAWAEIYLLSLSDALITSGWSTFGYSAQALAGIKPWILLRSQDGQLPNPPCVRARSIEPCLHVPLTPKCLLRDIGSSDKGKLNPARILRYVQACEDVPWGIKLITEPLSQER